MAFAARRAHEQFGQLSLLTLVTLLVVAGIGGIDAVADRMLAAGATRMLATAEPDAQSVRIVANAVRSPDVAPGADADPDTAAQDASIREAIATAFADTPIAVKRQADDDTSMITWEVAPSRIELADIPRLQRALTALDGLPDAVDPRREHNTRVVGELGQTVQRQAAAITATRGLLVAPQLIIALLGALVLGVVIAAVSASRGEELVLIRSRGASLRRLTGTAAAGAAGFVAVGALLATAILALTVGVTAVALLTAVGALAFAGIAPVLSILQRVGGVDIERPDAMRSDARSRPLPALILPACIAVGLAALSAWQVFATGSALRADGTVDPLAAAAPALLLVAACVLAPLAAGPLAALAERLLRRTRGISPILPLRQIARRMGSTAVAILCLALAAASVALAAAAVGVRDAAEQSTRLALLGGDVRMVSDDGDGLRVSAAAAERLSGVASAAEVLRTPISVGSDTVELLVGSRTALGLNSGNAAHSPSTAGRLPVTLTRSLAKRLGARPGTVFAVQIRSIAGTVPIEVTRIVDAMPGIGDGWGAAASDEQFARLDADLPVNELWIDSRDPETTATQLRELAPPPARVLTAAQVSAAPVTSVAPTVLMAGSLVAAVLSVIGFLAASAATARARRGESLVLRAFGLHSARRRAMRIGETAGVAVYAVLVGAGLGTIVAVVALPVVLGVTS